MAHQKLTTKGIKARRKTGYYGDGNGLYLQVRGRTKSWIFRYARHGRTHDMGLGSLALVTLAEARDKALACRKLLLNNIDPIAARHGERSQARLEAAKAMTFRTCADRYITSHSAGWKSAKHKYQWRQTLDIACETLGDLPVAAVDTGLVLKVLEPIWTVTPETASRLRQRIEAVLDWATAREYRQGENPARWRGHLKTLLPETSKLARVRHHPALPYGELPQFMAELRAREGVAARALEFAILTAARTNEVIGATQPEIISRVWTILAARMKAGNEHRVPLPDRALAIVSSLPREEGNPHLFMGSKRGQPISATAMLKLLNGMRPGLTVHGFRSTFSDWAHDTTAYPKVVIDMALAHTVGDKVEAAYRRGELFEKRRLLMDAWERYCEQGPVVSGDVIPMRGGAG